MTSLQLVIQTLTYYWKTQLAILAGVIVGTATIAGAMIVGDSMRGSLRQMTLDRLGPVDFVVSGHRLVREQLAAEWQAELKNSTRVAPVILMPAGTVHEQDGVTRRAGNVMVHGMEQTGWEMLAGASVPLPDSNSVAINGPLANELNVAVGDEITLWLELPSTVPRDTLLGHKDNDSAEIRLTVSTILPDDTTAARFGLRPNQVLPLNAFVALPVLQDRLNIAEIRPSPRDPTGSPGRVNAMLLDIPDSPEVLDAARNTAAELEKSLARKWTIADLRLRHVANEELGFLSLESEQMILEDKLSEAIQRAADKLGWATSNVMVYLANSLENAKDPKTYSMYSTVAGLDVLTLAPPFGPFTFVGDSPAALDEFDVVINEFLAEDLKVAVGDEIRMRYHLVGSYGELPEEERLFTVKGIVAMTGPAVDRGLTPTVKGITDVESLDDWDQPFEMDLDKVTPRDDEYWDSYRATPKLFLPLKSAQELWPSRYGQLTSIRVAIPEGMSADEAAQKLSQGILAELTPEEADLAVQPILAYGLAAANGSTDFTGLFIGFSLFVIASAVILVGLLFRLGIEQRVRTLGLLAATGFTPRQVRRQVLLEGLGLVLVGGVIGAFAAIGYANLMVLGLKTWWIGAVGTRFLSLYLRPESLLIGAVSSAFAAFAAIIWSTRNLQSLSIREHLQGTTEVATDAAASLRAGQRSRFRALVLASFAGLLIAGAVTGVIPSTEAFSGLSWTIVVFFVAGMSMLAASLMAFSGWLRKEPSQVLAGHGWQALARLGFRNAARSRARSVMSAALIASATFLIVAVAAGQKNPAEEGPNIASGNGGFTLVAESSSPVLYDLNTPEGRDKLNLLPAAGSEVATLLAETKVFQFRMKPGEEASCLNLFQTSAPTILGVPPELIARGGFKFVGTGESNPWKLLNRQNDDGTIPVFGDMNTLMFSLKKGPGSVVELDGDGEPTRLRIDGMLDGSIFQGVLLMSDENFRRLFPDARGFRYFLIETPPVTADKVAEFFETRLAAYGFDSESVAERLARFLSVQNTYLSTFQSLGGLGLLLGTFGLATVMLRNVLERQSELALLRAIGFSRGKIVGLILSENAFVLCWGLISGTIAALLAMLPHLTGTGADVPWLSGGLTLAAVFLTGMATSWFAIRSAVRPPIVTTLRGE